MQTAKYPYTLSPDINEAPAALTNGPHQQMSYNLCPSGSCSLYLNEVFDGPPTPVGFSPKRQTTDTIDSYVLTDQVVAALQGHCCLLASAVCFLKPMYVCLLI